MAVSTIPRPGISYYSNNNYTNYDDLPTGWTFIPTSITNTPVDGGQFTVLTLKYSDTIGVQMAFRRNSTANVMYLRRLNSTWTSWSQVTVS